MFLDFQSTTAKVFRVEPNVCSVRVGRDSLCPGGEDSYQMTPAVSGNAHPPRKVDGSPKLPAASRNRNKDFFPWIS